MTVEVVGVTLVGAVTTCLREKWTESALVGDLREKES